FHHMSHRHPRSTLFPYTTLFRSTTAATTWRRGPNSAAAAEMKISGRKAMARRIFVSAPFVTRGRFVVSNFGDYRVTRAFHRTSRSEEHTSELQSLRHLVCRLLLE